MEHKATSSTEHSTAQWVCTESVINGYQTFFMVLRMWFQRVEKHEFSVNQNWFQSQFSEFGRFQLNLRSITSLLQILTPSLFPRIFLQRTQINVHCSGSSIWYAVLLKGLEMFSRAIITLGTPPVVLVLDISPDWCLIIQFTQGQLGWVWFSLPLGLTAMTFIAQLCWPCEHLAQLTFAISSVLHRSPNSCVEIPWRSAPVPTPAFIFSPSKSTVL